MLTVVYFEAKLLNQKTVDPNITDFWDTVSGDPGNDFNAASGKFVVPVRGLYQFTVSLMNAVGGAYTHLTLIVDKGAYCTSVAGKNVNF